MNLTYTQILGRPLGSLTRSALTPDEYFRRAVAIPLHVEYVCMRVCVAIIVVCVYMRVTGSTCNFKRRKKGKCRAESEKAALIDLEIILKARANELED